MSRLAAALSSVTLAPVMLALMMLGAAPAIAQDADDRPTQSMAGVIPGYEPSVLEQGVDRLPMLAEAFGARVEAVTAEEGLSSEERGRRIAALWGEYGPEIMSLALAAGETGLQTTANMLENMDIGALVGNALAVAFAGLATDDWRDDAETATGD